MTERLVLAVWSGMMGTADSGPADTEDTGMSCPGLHLQSQTAEVSILLYIICRDQLILNEIDVI